MQHTLRIDPNAQLGPATVLEDEGERLLLAAASVEDATMRLVARSADLENQALAEVARFETQRVLVMDALARMHAAELTGTMADMPRDRFLSAEQEKQRLWANVESLWADSRRCLLWASDRRARTERMRDEASRLFEQAMLLRYVTPTACSAA